MSGKLFVLISPQLKSEYPVQIMPNYLSMPIYMRIHSWLTQFPLQVHGLIDDDDVDHAIPKSGSGSDSNSNSIHTPTIRGPRKTVSSRSSTPRLTSLHV